MKSTSAILLALVAAFAGVIGGIYGIYQVAHGLALPVARPSSLVTMPAIGIILAGLAYPIYRYRKQTLEFAKAAATEGFKPAVARPKRLDPFYAVRVLLLAKATAVASAAIGGFHVGLVILQLTTPVVAATVWLNVAGVIGAVLAMVIGLIVERLCKIQDGPSAPANGEVPA
ncbi:MAG: hypothetical protein RJA35_1301 [Actinomycetota bacterium]